MVQRCKGEAPATIRGSSLNDGLMEMQMWILTFLCILEVMYNCSEKLSELFKPADSQKQRHNISNITFKSIYLTMIWEEGYALYFSCWFIYIVNKWSAAIAIVTNWYWKNSKVINSAYHIALFLWEFIRAQELYQILIDTLHTQFRQEINWLADRLTGLHCSSSSYL